MDTFVNSITIKYSNRRCNIECLRNEMLISEPITLIFRTNVVNGRFSEAARL